MKDKYEALKYELDALLADCETIPEVWGERSRLTEVILRRTSEKIQALENKIEKDQSIEQ